MLRTLTFFIMASTLMAQDAIPKLGYGSQNLRKGEERTVVSADVYQAERNLYAQKTNILWLMDRLKLAAELELTEPQVVELNAINDSESHTDAFLAVVPQHPQFPGIAIDLTELPISKLKTLAEVLVPQYAAIDQRTDVKVREILNKKQNKRLNEILFQYYWIQSSPREPVKALALYGIEVDEADVSKLHALTPLVTNRDTVRNDRQSLLTNKLTALRSVVGASAFDRTFGRFEITEDQETEHRTKNPRRSR